MMKNGTHLVKVILVQLSDERGKVGVLEHARKDRLGELVHVLTKRRTCVSEIEEVDHRERRSRKEAAVRWASVTFTTKQSPLGPHDTTCENE